MKNKISPLEELRLERIQLKKEIEEHEQNLLDNIEYAKENWGSLLLSSVFASSTNSLKSFFGAGSKDENGNSEGYSSILDRFVKVVPVIWTFIQPVLIGLLTKKVTSFFFGEKR